MVRAPSGLVYEYGFFRLFGFLKPNGNNTMGYSRPLAEWIVVI